MMLPWVAHIERPLAPRAVPRSADCLDPSRDQLDVELIHVRRVDLEEQAGLLRLEQAQVRLADPEQRKLAWPVRVQNRTGDALARLSRLLDIENVERQTVERCTRVSPLHLPRAACELRLRMCS